MNSFSVGPVFEINNSFPSDISENLKYILKIKLFFI
jgi:hypothetical protein